jgi:WD40 repeat protein
MLGSGHTLKSSNENVPTPFNSLVLAPNGEFVVTLEEEFHSSTLARTRTPRRFWAPDCAFVGAAVSPNGSHISAMSSEERLLVLDVEDLGQAARFGPGGRRSVWRNGFSPDGRRIASAGHVLRMVDVESGNELWALPRDNYVFLTVAFRPDGKTIATGSQDTSIRLWNAETGKETAILRGHHGQNGQMGVTSRNCLRAAIHPSGTGESSSPTGAEHLRPGMCVHSREFLMQFVI